MPYEKTNAIVIRRADYSETSLVLTFYARTFGRISALAKGAKRKHSRIIGHVDLLSHGEIVFASARGRDRLHILSEACAFETFPSVRRKVERYYAGCHAAALVENLTAPDDPNPDVFDRLLGLLRGLEAGVDPAVALPAFEAHLLVLTGFMPEVTACVTCGKEIRVPAVAFSPRLGGVMCGVRCVWGLPPSVVLAGATPP